MFISIDRENDSVRNSDFKEKPQLITKAAPVAKSAATEAYSRENREETPPAQTKKSPSPNSDLGKNIDVET